MKKITLSLFTVIIMLSMIFSSSVFAANEKVGTSAWDTFKGFFSASATETDQIDGVTYQTHIQNEGWEQGWVSDGEMSGSEGKGLRLEGIEIEIDDANLPDGLGIRYQTHIQNEGWEQGWVSNGEMSGSEGKGLRLEGIEIELTGTNASDYSVYYQTHIQNEGWTQGWVSDGEMSGSEGKGLRLEGIEIEIEKVEADLTAYNTALADVTESDYTVASWDDYQAVVDDNVVTADELQSEVNAATNDITAAQEDLVLIPKVTSVTATYPKTIIVKGTALAGLTAADIFVESNDVVSFVANAAGTEATITLDSNLAPGVDTDVKITIEGITTTYVVNFVLDVEAITVVETTFDDDRADQKATFKVDGQLADVDYLALAGYNVQFVATDKDDAPYPLFVSGNTSTTGVLAGGLTIGTYSVEVILTKSGVATVSDIGLIEIANIDGEVTSIDAVEFGVGAFTDIPYDADYTNDAFKMNSKTLIAGEKASIHQILATVGGEQITVPGAFEVTSSNPAVISVDGTTFELTANTKGTAVITVKVGDQTKTFTFTVATVERKISKVTATPSTTKGVVGADDMSVKFTSLDQYGDPFAVAIGNGAADQITEAIPNNTAGTDPLVGTFEVVTDAANSIGVATIDITPNAVGTGTVYFKDYKNNVVGTLGLNITDVNNVASKKLEIVTGTDQSSDNNLEFTDSKDNTVQYRLGLYNTNGVFVGLGDFSNDYTVTSVDIDVATVDATAGDSFLVSAVDAGATDIVVTNTATSAFVAKIRVTVTNNPYEISSIAFKSVGTINYIGKDVFAKDVFNLTLSDYDDIVNNVTLSRTSSSKVRICETAVAPIAVDDLYLDLDNNGVASTGDVYLGSVQAEAASDAVGVTANAYETGYVANSMISTTASGNKGTILVKVYSENTLLPVDAIAGTSFSVDVK